MNWDEIFSLSVPPLELIVRGTVMYWFVFFVFRFLLRRGAGSVAIADIIILVIIADAAQNGMAGDAKSATDAMILISTIALWTLAIDWLSFRSPAFRRFAEPRTLQMIENGRVNDSNRKRELMSEEELRSQLREKGVESPEEVKAAYMEPNGTFSVIRRRRDDEQPPGKEKVAAGKTS